MQIDSGRTYGLNDADVRTLVKFFFFPLTLEMMLMDVDVTEWLGDQYVSSYPLVASHESANDRHNSGRDHKSAT